MDPIIETESLLRQGRLAEAWRFVERQIRELPLDDSTLSFVHQATILANLHGSDEIFAWVRALERRARAQDLWTPRVSNALRAVQIAALHNAGKLSRLDPPTDDIDWTAIQGLPTLHASRCRTLLLQGEVDRALREGLAAIETLRRPEGSGTRDPDTAELVEALVLSVFVMSGLDVDRRPDDASRLLEICEGSERLLLDLLGLQVRARLGRQSIWAGRLDNAERHLRRAVEDARRLHLPARAATFSDHLALAYVERGAIDLCRKTLAEHPVPARLPSRTAWADQVNRLVNRCWILVQLGELENAQRLLRRVRYRLEEGTNSVISGFALLCEAGIAFETARRLGRTQRRRSLRRTVELCKRAEGQFRELGTFATSLRANSLSLRARALLASGRVRDALDCLAESLASGEGRQTSVNVPRTILIKSYALLDAEDSRLQEAIYEEILRDLGQISDPVVLFEVIANLYMFTWSLDDRLDLTDHHFGQLEKLRDSLDGEVFARLYATHVARRVAKRAFRRFFPEPPDGLLS